MHFLFCLRKGIGGSSAVVFILCGSLLLFLTGCNPTAGHFHYKNNQWEYVERAGYEVPIG